MGNFEDFSHKNWMQKGLSIRQMNVTLNIYSKLSCI